MKIVQFTAENIKKLTVVDITPSGNMVQITGKNGQGKSSVLDAIWMALEWSEAAQPEPIRSGADKARIRLDLGEMIVTRTFSRREPPKDDVDLLLRSGEKSFTTAIKVESRDGARYPSPQAMIDKLIGGMSLDPVKFLNAKAPEQFEMLRGLVPDFDFAAMEKSNAEDYAARTEQNRRAKEYRTRADAIALPDGLPAERVDEDALTAELEEAGRIATEIERAKADDDRRRTVISSFKEQAEASRRLAGDHRQRASELIRKAEALELEAMGFEFRARNGEQYFQDRAPIPTPPDTAAIRAAMAKARITNQWIDLRTAKETFGATAVHYEKQAEALTDAMRARDSAAQAAIANAKLPIPNLTFSGQKVLMNGVPFAQASTAERLRTSLAVAMAANPKLRVIRIVNGNDIDDDGLRLIADEAAKHDYQVWIERIASDGKTGFVLEDGHLKEEV